MSHTLPHDHINIYRFPKKELGVDIIVDALKHSRVSVGWQ